MRGQAMIEYSVINWLLIVALILSTTVKMVPTPSGNRNIIETLMLAYQNYLDSYVFTLTVPFP